MFLKGYHLAQRKRKLTIISTSSRIMQLISLAPAPTRALADIETLGPICLQSYRVSYILFLEHIPIKKFALHYHSTTTKWTWSMTIWPKLVDETGITFEVGCTLADGWMYTSPTIVAVLLPSPEAKRWGDVRRNWERYNPEHLKDILHNMEQWLDRNSKITKDRIKNSCIYPGVLICSQKSSVWYVYSSFFPARGDKISWSNLTKSAGSALLTSKL